MVFYKNADSRVLTNYKQDCIVEQEMKDKYQIKDNFEYKMFLQRNAEKLMQENVSKMHEEMTTVCTCKACSKK
jgi:hypothetical protein